jgi:hypothetical protein
MEYSSAPISQYSSAPISQYSSAPISAGNTFQDLPWLCETAVNTEHYI